MFWEQDIQVAVETHIGLRRKNNEDASCCQLCQSEAQWAERGHLFVVADGMGGHAVGELASRLAVETVPHTFFKATERDVRSALREAVINANETIYRRGSTTEDFLHMGTTCTSLVLCQRGAILAHVGDSRAYRVRRDRIDQLTFDHSLEWELERRNQSLIGVVDMSQHRNIITRSLGPEAQVEVDIEGPHPILPGDIFVLCSDGLSNQVADEEIGAIVRELPPEAAARLLIQLANVRGGPDNSTVIVVRVGELPANIQPLVYDHDDDQKGQLEWSWLIGFSVAAFMMFAGLGMLLTGHPTKGIVSTVLSVLAFLVMGIVAFRRLQRQQQDEGESSRTRILRSHRTAVCLDSKGLYDRLLEIVSDLQRAAQEDGWSVDWKALKSAIVAAQQSAKEKRYAKGIRQLTRAVGMLMDEHPLPT